MMYTERVRLRVIKMPCCGTMLCSISPRLPNYCPECGKSTVQGQVLKEHVVHTDDEAQLRHNQDFQFRRTDVSR